MSSDQDVVIKVIRSLVISTDNADFRTIIKDYREEEGELIPFRRFGYSSLEEFLRASGEFILAETSNGIQVMVKKSQSSAHIVDLRQHQTRPRKKRSAKSKPMTQARRPQSCYKSMPRNNSQPISTFNRSNPTVNRPNPTFNQPNPNFNRPNPNFNRPNPNFNQPTNNVSRPTLSQIAQHQIRQVQLNIAAQQYHDAQRARRENEIRQAQLALAMQQQQNHQSILQNVNVLAQSSAHLANVGPQSRPLVNPMPTGIVSAPTPLSQFPTILRSMPMHAPIKPIDVPIAKSNFPASNTCQLTTTEKLRGIVDNEEVRSTPLKSDKIAPIITSGKVTNSAHEQRRCIDSSHNTQPTPIIEKKDNQPKTASGGFRLPHPPLAQNEKKTVRKSIVGHRLIIKPTESFTSDSNESIVEQVIKPKTAVDKPVISTNTSTIAVAEPSIGRRQTTIQPSVFGSNASITSDEWKAAKVSVNQRLKITPKERMARDPVSSNANATSVEPVIRPKPNEPSIARPQISARNQPTVLGKSASGTSDDWTDVKTSVINHRPNVMPTQPINRNTISSSTNEPLIKSEATEWKPNKPFPTFDELRVITAFASKLSLGTSIAFPKEPNVPSQLGASTKRSSFDTTASQTTDGGRPKISQNCRMLRKPMELSNDHEDLRQTLQPVQSTSARMNVGAWINSLRNKPTSTQPGGTLRVTANFASQSRDVSTTPNIIARNRKVSFAPRPLKAETIASSSDTTDPESSSTGEYAETAIEIYKLVGTIRIVIISIFRF